MNSIIRLNNYGGFEELHGEIMVFPTHKYDHFDYTIDIITDLSKPFDDIMPKKEDFKKITSELEDYIENFSNFDAIDNVKMEYLKKNLEKVAKEAEYIMFDLSFSNKKIREYIKNNPCVKEKKLVFVSSDVASEELYNDILNNFSDMLDNIYIDTSENTVLISFKEFEHTILELNKLIESIKKLNLSPFETIMYVYDLVKEKIYKENDDNLAVSRNIPTVLSGTNIVCVGYAKLFNKILEKLEIPSYLFYLKGINGTDGHARSEVYVKDNKYDLDGVYFFDPTWDSKRSKQDINYINRYSSFALTAKEMVKEDRKINLIPETILTFDIDESILLEGLKTKDDSDCDYIVNTINHMSRVLGRGTLIPPAMFLDVKIPEYFKVPTIEDIMSQISDIEKKYYRKIPDSAYIKALFNVRKTQYYNNPEKYPFDIKSIATAAYISNWNCLSLEEKLLVSIYQEEISEETRAQRIGEELRNNDIPKKVKQVQFTKIIRDIKDKQRVR